MTALETTGLVVAIVGGVLGSVLGLINLWREIDRKRVRLKVIPKLAHMVTDTFVVSTHDDSHRDQGRFSHYPARLCVEVINLSEFAVTLTAVGFGDNSVVINPDVSQGKKWPTRLEPREAVTLYSGVEQGLSPESFKEPVAFVRTECGIRVEGKSPVLKKYFVSLQNSEASS